MIVLGGIDLGLRKAHVFMIHESGEQELFHVDLQRMLRRDMEIKEIHRKIKDTLSGVTAPFFVEEPLVAGARNIRVSLGIAQTAGAVISALRGPAYLVPVSTWKMETVGKGNAKKNEVRSWLFEKKHAYSMACERTNSPQDYIDAACIALYGSKVLGLDF